MKARKIILKQGDRVLSRAYSTIGIIDKVIKGKYRVRVCDKNVWHDRDEIEQAE